MILVDTSIWIDHFRKADHKLADFLDKGQVLTHPFVIQELAYGRLHQRDEILGLLETLTQTPQADYREILTFISQNHLHGAGLGVIDIHLLAAARLAHTTLWTRDKKLRRAAACLDILHSDT